MKENISIFVKFLSPKYIDDLLNGKIFMNRLNYFIDLESDGIKGQGDILEGKIPYDFIKFRDGVTETKVTRYVSYGMESYPVYCLMQLFPYAFNKNGAMYKFSSFEQYNQMRHFSEDCVVIHNPDEFIKRFQMACTRQNLKFYHAKVYYDEDDFLNQLVYNEINKENIKSIFYKNSFFKLQQEYRFCIFTKVQSSFVLDIGNIRDVAVVRKTSDFFK